MLNLILLLIISFFTGVFTKLVDLIEDHGLKLFKFDKYFFALIYGLLIGYVISSYNVIAPLWVGTIFALILAKKIDTKAHVIGLISALIFVIIFGLGKINILFLIIFLIAAFLDEILSDFADKSLKKKSILKKIIFKLLKNKIKINKKIKKMLELRPLLEITALIISIIIWNFYIFLSILFYDIGYNLTNKIGLKITK